MSDYPGIKNFEVILNHFGSWPSFHDAEILSLLIERKAKESMALLPLLEFMRLR